MKIKEKKKLTKEWFIKLQNIICNNVEKLEKEYGSKIKFKKNKWKHGEFRIIKGEVIEKGGVAFSNVIGKFPNIFYKIKIFFPVIHFIVKKYTSNTSRLISVIYIKIFITPSFVF